MSIPDYQSIMRPLLKQASDRQEHSFPSLVESLASEFRLTDSERRDLLPSGGQFVFDNRVGWARTYLKKAGLLWAPKRGVVQITDRGLQVLKDNPERIDNKVLRRFPEFLEFQSAKGDAVAELEATASAERLDPQENIEAGYQRIRKELSGELLTRIKACSPAFFERLVVDLLLKMGYGGSRRDFGQAIGKPGDGGIDAVIRIGWGWTRSTCRLSAGTAARSAAKRSKPSWVPCMEGRLARESSLPPVASLSLRTTT
jgi:restriction system protein